MLEQQLLLILQLMATGFAFGLIYDLYAVGRNLFCVGKWITFILDLFIWFLFTMAVVLVLLEGTWLEVRFYVFASLFCGWLVYYFTLSKSFTRGTRLIGEKVVAVAVKIKTAIIGFNLKKFFRKQDK